ncbi:MAG: hypothetical protein H0W64_08055 [Gammaproteobacteria bacterium]|nr:hypothetical protein [Gammaproteobacteria bacterium]
MGSLGENSMQSSNLTEDYIIANGPEGLKEVLQALFEKASNDPDFATVDHFVLYELGDQRSLIKVDTAKEPYQFWYNDLLGRPATKIVRETIADFLWEKFGDGEISLKDEENGHVK